MEDRDRFVDVAKGLMILSVINIHTVYWSLSEHVPDVVKHLAYLADVPLFFFISGYLFKNRTFLVAVKGALRQFLRLYLHYVVISFLVALGIMLAIHLSEDRLVGGAAEGLASIFTVQPSGEMWDYLRGYGGNLWFVRTYFPLLLLAPLLVGLPRFLEARLPILIFVLLLYSLTTYHYKNKIFLLADLGQISFYAVFFVLGAVYRTGEQGLRSRDIALSLGLNCLLGWIIFHFDGNTLRLGRYKFLPSFQYLVFSLLLVHLFMVVKPHGKRLAAAGGFRFLAPLRWAGENTFILYLVQGAVCSVPFLFLEHLRIDSPAALYGIVFSFNVLGTFLLSFIYVAGRRSCDRLAASVWRHFGDVHR